MTAPFSLPREEIDRMAEILDTDLADLSINATRLGIEGRPRDNLLRAHWALAVGAVMDVMREQGATEVEVHSWTDIVLAAVRRRQERRPSVPVIPLHVGGAINLSGARAEGDDAS
jgi:hypothetical protein